MLYDYTSDVHVEQWAPWGREALKLIRAGRDPYTVAWEYYRHPGSRMLVLNGDTANDPHTTIRNAKEAAKFYEYVLIVDGNHEHYSSKSYKWETNQTCDFLREQCEAHEGPGTLAFLDGKTSVVIDGTLFIGACGWYSFIMPDYNRETCHWRWKRMSNDGRYIRFQRYPDKLALYHAQLLEVQVAMVQADPSIERIAVFTHTCPVLKGLVQSSDPEWQQLSGAYWNAYMERVLDADTHGKIKTWHFGHTHFVMDFVYRGVRFICAPRGYPGDTKNRDRRWSGPLQLDTDQMGGGRVSAFGEIEEAA